MRSSVAGILDDGGGLRVVVTQKRRFKHHVGPGEVLFVVPDYLVQEPVPWNDIPAVVTRVERHIAEWIRTRNDPDTLKTPAVVRYIERKT